MKKHSHWTDYVMLVIHWTSRHFMVILAGMWRHNTLQLQLTIYESVAVQLIDHSSLYMTSNACVAVLEEESLLLISPFFLQIKAFSFSKWRN